ncbi:MAG: FadR/GntR family transcriptional regulator [Candidatus Azotimanducaceae bacterium WSBS_2022_MAG_OTU7]
MSGDQRMYKSIVDKLLLSIDSGEFPVGGRLPPERELAERYSVSRPTIREAIIALEALERVEVQNRFRYLRPRVSHRKTRSQTLPSAHFELTEARAMIEGEAAALAALIITNEQLTELEIALNEMSSPNPLVFENADKKFHEIIAHATSNKMMDSVISNLWYIRDNSPIVHQAYQSICETDGNVRVQEEHVEIFDALKKRDDKAARSAMHQHFSRIIKS